MFKTKVDDPIDCPKCFVKMNKLDAQVPKKHVVMDVCPTCNGIWLDKNELGKILGNRKLSDYLTKQIGTKHAEDVEVDVCLNCAGIWLDPGELAELTSLSEEGFIGDAALKAEELAEERKADRTRTLLERFKRKMDL